MPFFFFVSVLRAIINFSQCIDILSPMSVNIDASSLNDDSIRLDEAALRGRNMNSQESHSSVRSSVHPGSVLHGPHSPLSSRLLSQSFSNARMDRDMRGFNTAAKPGCSLHIG